MVVLVVLEVLVVLVVWMGGLVVLVVEPPPAAVDVLVLLVDVVVVVLPGLNWTSVLVFTTSISASPTAVPLAPLIFSVSVFSSWVLNGMSRARPSVGSTPMGISRPGRTSVALVMFSVV